MATSSEPTNFLLIGNPGTGKSTILNGLIGKAVFKSGVSYGKGLTFQFDKHKEGVHTYMDTPGLADIDLRKQAAAAITEALKQDGYYKIFFVVVLVNGRVKAEDVTTMKLVLDAAPITDYGIIINQVPRKQYKDLMENPSGEEPSPYERVCACLTPAMSSGKASLRVVFLQRDDELEDATDVVKSTSQVLSILAAIPGVMIDSKDVVEIRGQDFEELQKEMEKKLQDIREENRSLQHMLEEGNLEIKSLAQQQCQQELEAQEGLNAVQMAGRIALSEAQEECNEKLRAQNTDFRRLLAEQGQAFQLQHDAEQHKANMQVQALAGRFETMQMETEKVKSMTKEVQQLCGEQQKNHKTKLPSQQK